jgi:hypothetical protein
MRREQVAALIHRRPPGFVSPEMARATRERDDIDVARTTIFGSLDVFDEAAVEPLETVDDAEASEGFAIAQKAVE